MKRLLATSVCVGLLLTLLTACFSAEMLDIYIFENISECEKISQNKPEDATVEVYQSTEKDKKLDGLQYESFFGAKYSSSELTFEIFAYEFQDTEEAHQYFYNHTGRESDRDTNFFGSGGMFSYDLVVIDGKNAYFASTSSGDVDEMYEFFSNVFSTKLF